MFVCDIYHQYSLVVAYMLVGDFWFHCLVAGATLVAIFMLMFL